MAKVLWSATGTLLLSLGIVGIVVPLLPTTPFLLLASACYLRGSSRMRGWMLTNRLFGQYLSDYSEGRGISLRVKVGTILLLWAVIGFSVVTMTDSSLVRLVLLVIVVGVTVHILKIKAKGRTRHLGAPASVASQQSDPP